MALTKITQGDLTNKGVVGLPDTPGLQTLAMQEKFDEIARDVIVPKHNGLIDELEAETAASSLGATATPRTTGSTTVQQVLNGLDTSIGSVIDLAEEAVSTANIAASTAGQALTTANEAKTFAQNAVTTANNTKAYVELEVENLEREIIERTTVVDPTTGLVAALQTVIDDLYNFMRPAALTAEQYDDLGLTAQVYDEYALTAYQYDMYAAQLLV